MPPKRIHSTSERPEEAITNSGVCVITDTGNRETLLGYLGYDDCDTREIQYLVCHPWFVEKFTALSPLIKAKSLQRSEGFDSALPHLRDIYSADNEEQRKTKTLDTIDEALKKLRKSTDRKQAAVWIAAFLWHWEQEVSSLQDGKVHTEAADGDADVYKAFQALTGHDIPDRLRYKLTEVPIGLQWKFMSRYEKKLEMCNRLWLLLWLGHQSLFKPEQIQTFLRDIKDGDKACKAYKCQNPQWWKPDPEEAQVPFEDPIAVAARIGSQFAGQQQPLKAFKKIDHISAKLQFSKDELAEWEEHQDELHQASLISGRMNTVIDCVANPCARQSMEYWRDGLRRQLDLVDYQADLRRIDMELTTTDGDRESDCIYDKERDLKKSLAQIHGKLQADNITRVHFSIQLDIGETDVRMEATELPHGADAFIEMGNDDVAFRAPSPQSYAATAPEEDIERVPSPPPHAADASPVVDSGMTEQYESAQSYVEPQPATVSQESMPPTHSVHSEDRTLQPPDVPTSQPQHAPVSQPQDIPASSLQDPTTSPPQDAQLYAQPQPTAPPAAISDVPIRKEWAQWKAHIQQRRAEGKLESDGPTEYALANSILQKTLQGGKYKLDGLDRLPMPVSLNQPRNRGSKKHKSEIDEYIVDEDNAFDTMLKQAEKQKLKKNWKIPNKPEHKHLNQKRTPEDELELDRFERPWSKFKPEEYDDFDTRINSGLLEWQCYAINYALNEPTAQTKSGKTKLKTKELKEFENILKTMQDQDIDRDPELVEDPKDGTATLAASSMDIDVRRVESVLAGTEELTGPGVDACLELMEMEYSEMHRDSDIQKYRSKLMPRVRGMSFLPSQVTGLVYMLFKSCGEFPLCPQQKVDPEINKKLKAVYAKGEVLKVPGGFVADGAGMGKTALTMAYIDWFSQFVDHRDAAGNLDHRPTLIMCPAGIVLKQWAELISDCFPGIKLLIAKSGEQFTDRPTRANNWRYIGTHDFDSLENFPYKDILDKNNPEASQHAVLVSYTTMRERIASKVRARDEDQKVHPPPPGVFLEKGETYRKQYIIKGWMRGMFKIAVYDEGHILRNETSLVHWTARNLETDINWIVTATPLVNTHEDVINESRLLWPAAEKMLKASGQWSSISKRIEKFKASDKPWEFWKELGVNDLNLDVEQLAILEPEIFDRLLKCPDLRTVAEYSAPYEKLTTLRRQRTSRLPGYAKGKNGELDLKNIMKPHRMKTVRLRHATEEEEREHQLWHRIHFLAYKEICKDNARAKAAGNDVGPPAVLPVLRQMSVVASTPLLSRLERYLQMETSSDTHVENINKWRDQNFSADMFLQIVCGGTPDSSADPPPGDAQETPSDAQQPPPSRAKRFKKLLHGCEKGKEILTHVRDFMIPKPGEKQAYKKLLITEEFPLIAWFYEMLLTFLHIPTQVIHSGLDQHERDEVVEQFNTPAKEGDLGHTSVVILMYNVNAAGVNLHMDCWRCIVATAASSTAFEVQAWSRLLRVAQEMEVEIFRLSLQNSHDEYRDAAQATKSLIDAAMKATGSKTEQIILSVLNRFGKTEAEKIWNSPLGKAARRVIFGDVDTKAAVEEVLRDEDEAIKIPATGTQGDDNDPSTDATGHKAMPIGPADGDGDADGIDPQAPLAETSAGHEAMPGAASTGDDNAEPTVAGVQAGPSLEQEKRKHDLFKVADNEDDSDQIAIHVNRNTHGPMIPTDIKRLGQYVKDQYAGEDQDVGQRMQHHWKHYYSSGMTDVEKHTFNQNLIYTTYIVSLPDPYKSDYTKEDLNKDPLAFERALRIMHRIRFGQDFAAIRISPTIDYSGLGPFAVNKLKDKIAREMHADNLDNLAEAFGIERRYGANQPITKSSTRREKPAKTTEELAILHERDLNKSLSRRSQATKKGGRDVNIPPPKFERDNERVLSTGMTIAQAEESIRNYVIKQMRENGKSLHSLAFRYALGKEVKLSHLNGTGLVEEDDSTPAAGDRNDTSDDEDESVREGDDGEIYVTGNGDGSGDDDDAL